MDQTLDKPWQKHSLNVWFPPTMLVPEELSLLNWLTSHYYRNEGLIVDGGCFLGGSTIALASGLPKNLVSRIHSYDIFSAADPYWFPGLKQFGVEKNEYFEKKFIEHIRPYNDKVVVHSGDLIGEKWTGEPIEILFLDICKTVALQDYTTQVWFPRLIPGRSIVVQQDYGWLNCHWGNVMMEVFKEHFTILDDLPTSTRVYLCTSKVQDTDTKLFATLPIEERLARMSDAVATTPPGHLFRPNLLYNQALIAEAAGRPDVVRQALAEMVEHPDRYKSLAVAVSRFLDYFQGPDGISLRPWRPAAAPVKPQNRKPKKPKTLVGKLKRFLYRQAG